MDTKTINLIMDAIGTGYTDHNGITHRANRQLPVIIALQAHLDMPMTEICALKVENIVNAGNTWVIKTETTTQRIPDRLKAFIDQWTRHKGIKDGSLFSISEYAVYKHMRNVAGYLEMDHISCDEIREYAKTRQR